MKLRRSRWFSLTLVLGVLMGMLAGAGGLRAQEAGPKPKAVGPTALDYSQSRAFPNLLAPYSTRYVPEPAMSNSERVHALIRDGKMQLSLDDALALALENNLDIAIARYTPAYAQTDLLRTRAGGATRGVNPALFGGVQAFAGAAGGGGGGGTGGAGGFTGGGGATNLGSANCCDPFAGFNVGWDQRSSPLNTLVVSGIPVFNSHNTSYSTFFGQGFLTGTSYVMAVNGFRQSSNSNFLLFNPEVPTFMGITLAQRLLNGFGYRANAKFIRIAQNNVRFADSSFRQLAITSVTQILNLYYDLVSFRENVRVAEKALALAEKTLSDNKRQVEIGTLAPIEVVRAESEVAARQQDLIVAQTMSQQQQELLKTALAKHVDPDLAAAEIIPTDQLPQPKPDDIPPLDQALREAAQNRPEIEQADLNIRNQEITIQASRNALLPTLDVFGSYAPVGLSGNRLVFGPCPAGSTPAPNGTGCVAGGTIVPQPILGTARGGSLQSLNQVLHGRFPDYSFGATLQIPIRNRSAQADAATALLQERQLRTQLLQQKNRVEQDVRNANIAGIQARAQIEAARKAVILAQQTLDAEQKKFQLGESTVFQVIQAQRDLATQEGNEVKARSAYAKALTQFAQATGTTLAKNRIELAEAKAGETARVPNIPGAGSKPAGDDLQSTKPPSNE